MFKEIFSLDMSLIETITRSSLTYLALFLILRIVLRRQSGSLSIADILLITLISDASQGGMVGESKTFLNGIIAASSLILTNLLVDYLGYKFHFIGKLIKPPPLTLIENGTYNFKNMRKELITKEEIATHLRINGIEDVSEVKYAYMEANGEISVIK